MLIIGILIITSSADAVPQGTVVKDGILTYPAGPYLREDPFLLSLESYGNYNATTSDNFSYIAEKEFIHFDKRNNVMSGSTETDKLKICPSNLCSFYFDLNKKILHPSFVFFIVYFSFF